MSAKTSRCVRAFVVAFVVAAVLGFGPAPASSAFAPSQDLETDEGFDGNETEGTIDRVRLQLLGVAAITGALLVVYIWHTDPERRRRVALRRRDRRERAALQAFDGEFVLPSDLDEASGHVDPPSPHPTGDGAGERSDGG